MDDLFLESNIDIKKPVSKMLQNIYLLLPEMTPYSTIR